MRQAYDYWQNQPGNYRSTRRGPRGAVAEVRTKRGLESRDWGAPECTQPTQPSARGASGRAGHPYAPTEFLRVPSAAGMPSGRKAARRRNMSPQRGGHPAPDTPEGGNERWLSPLHLAESRPEASNPQDESVPSSGLLGLPVPRRPRAAPRLPPRGAVGLPPARRPAAR